MVLVLDAVQQLLSLGYPAPMVTERSLQLERILVLHVGLQPDMMAELGAAAEVVVVHA